MLKIEIEDRSTLIDYSEFIKNNSFSTFYHSQKFLNFLENLLGLKMQVITARDSNEIKGILPFFAKNTIHGMVVNSLPFFGSYGGVIANSVDIHKKILEKLNQFNKENDVLSSVIINNPFMSNNYVYEKFFKYNSKEDRQIQCISLSNFSKEGLWYSFEQRVRRAVRKAEKNLLSIESLSNTTFELNEFYEMHKKDMERKNGKVKPKQFFDDLQNFFEVGKDFDILKAKKDNESIAYLLVFYFNSFVEYYMPAYNEEFKNLQGTSLLIWESLKSALDKKMLYYNFGGTWKDQHELYMFKKGWNSRDIYYQYILFRDLPKIKEIGIEELRKSFEHFYIVPFKELSTSDS